MNKNFSTHNYLTWARKLRRTATLGLAASAVTASAALIQTRLYQVKKRELPILAPGAPDFRILHLADFHYTPYRHLEAHFIRQLANLHPDLVISTGDLLGSAQAWPALRPHLQPLLDFPGAYVFGSNDYYAPKPKSWLTYLGGPSSRHPRKQNPPTLPWPKLDRFLQAHSWKNLSNTTAELELEAKSSNTSTSSVWKWQIQLIGTDDAHINRDRFPNTESAKLTAKNSHTLRIGVTHAPYQRVLNAFVSAQADLILAGHTHGGQVCLPFIGALVTNCDLPRNYASGLHTWPPKNGSTSLNVSPGLGTSPYAPVRMFCRPEVTLLTLRAKPFSP